MMKHEVSSETDPVARPASTRTQISPSIALDHPGILIDQGRLCTDLNFTKQYGSVNETYKMYI
jgi:hypothetical protein